MVDFTEHGSGNVICEYGRFGFCLAPMDSQATRAG